jgi:hypothetical protein
MTSLALLHTVPDCSEYSDWKLVRRALDEWAVVDKFTYRTPKKGKSIARYICAAAADGCRWSCNATKQPDGMIELRVSQREHTCWTGGVAKFSSSATKEWLDEATSQHLCVTKTTKPQEIVETIQIHFAETVSYKVAQLCRQRLLDGGLGKQRYSFQLLPAYSDAVELQCPRSTVDLQIDQRTGNFQRIFVCPLHSRTTFQQMRRIVAADGTFLTGRFVLTLLLAVGIDANGHNVILAWAVVESENRESWEYFLRLLRRCVPEVASDPCVFISDRDKGLQEADVVLGEKCLRAYCCKHIEGNLKDKFGGKAGLPALFWKAARAQLPSAFDYHMEKIAAINPGAAEYLRAIEPTLWAVAHFPGTRHSHLTQNIAESVNAILKEDRTLSITDLLNAIWHRVMAERSTRLEEARKQTSQNRKFTAYCQTKLEYSRKWMASNTVSYILHV